ncbi:MAG: thiamine ABC transporter substrate-binding protein [Spirochaetaceae bacterium]|nr:thiamine ABC transporter substrate-binding protein [Spirochaetaceae bacterium]
MNRTAFGGRLARLIATGVLVVAPLAAFAGPDAETSEWRRTVTVMTHDSFAASEEVLAAFESRHGVRVRILEAGDTGTALNKAILARGKPLADVIYGIDNTFLSRALDEDILEPYRSRMLASVPEEFQIDASHRALPVDYGDVCLNYHVASFGEDGPPPPKDLDDLIDPAYRGLTVVQNPATSSPGLSFLMATVARYGDPGYLDYWRSLVANDVLVVNDWETAYFTEFTGSAGQGPRPIVVSYGSSPPFEVLYAESPMDEPPTAAVTGPLSCFRQIEFVGILAGAENRDLAELWVDFMLSRTFQEDLPLNMFVFPVNRDAVLQKEFVDYLAVPDEPALLDPAQIAEHRERWIREWTEAVLR